jgi:hypothetical protein
MSASTENGAAGENLETQFDGNRDCSRRHGVQLRLAAARHVVLAQCCGLSGNYGSSAALFPRFRARPPRPDTG